MKIFFDTSAVVPLLLEENNTDLVGAIWSSVTYAYAWSWMRVETEAALIRRKADSQAWQVWRELQSQFHLLVLDPKEEALLRAFNRSLGLRAADAGHLFVFDRLLAADPGVDLLTYDQEMYDAALRLGLPVLNFQK